MKKIELIAPAGDLEKFYTAVLYGADAIYMGGKSLGLRTNPKNFTTKEMADAIQFAHKNNVRVYITVNIFAHNADFNGIEDYFFELQKLGADAIIVSDPGIFAMARKYIPNMNIHISTQANTTNYHSVNFWKEQGASRIVLARELSLKEIGEIHDKTGVELEAFVHGAMCISYSGRCLLSNYMIGRNANKGDCVHACRFSYNLTYNLVEETRPNEYFPVEEDLRGTYIMSSKDLCMITHIPDLINAGICSLKIEGRAKTPFYVGVITKAYREAIDDYYEDPKKYEEKKDYYLELVQKASHRNFTTGFYYNKPNSEAQTYDSMYIRNFDFVGVVKSYDEKTCIAVVEQRNKFSIGDEIEFIRTKDSVFKQVLTQMTNEEDTPVDSAPHPKQILRIKVLKPVEPFDMLCRATNIEN